jgi:ketosteroid isomerase-like protein
VSANLDLVRSIYADWERGDWSSVEWAHAQIEMEFVAGPTPGTWRGRNGIAEGWRDFLGVWTEFRAEADEYRELDDEQILVLTRWGGRGRTSSVDLDQVSTKAAVAFQFLDGKVTRLLAYFDRDRALADFGLEG